MGELGLDGRLRPVRRILPAILAAHWAGFTRVIVPLRQGYECLSAPLDMGYRSSDAGRCGAGSGDRIRRRVIVAGGSRPAAVRAIASTCTWSVWPVRMWTHAAPARPRPYKDSGRKCRVSFDRRADVCHTARKVSA